MRVISVSLVAGLLVVFASTSLATYYGSYYCQPGRDVFVHLFEWKWTDIKNECAWLAEKGFCAVQVMNRFMQ